jgi:enterobacterial common antigen flippase
MHLLLTRIGALQALGGLTFFIRTKVLAVVLGPAGMGVVSVVDQFVQVVMQLSAFAIPFAAMKVLSKAYSENIEIFRAAYADLLRLLLFLGALGGSLAIALVLFLPNWASASLEAHAMLAVIGLLSLPAIILHGFLRNVPAAALHPIVSAVWDVVLALIMTSTVTAGVLMFGVPGYFVGSLVGGVAVSVSYHWYLAHRFGVSVKGSPRGILAFIRSNPSFVQLSLSSYVVVFATPLAFFIVRTTVLDNIGAAAAGLLQAALGISLAINLVLYPLNALLLMPLLNRTIAPSLKYREAEEFQKKLLFAILLVALPPILFPDLVVSVLYSSEFVEVAPVLSWFVLGQAILQIAGVNTALMVGLDRLRAYALFMTAAMAANALLAVVLVPSLGLLGAGVAAFGSAIFLAVTTSIYLRSGSDFRPDLSLDMVTLFLLVGLALAGKFVGTRPSFEVPNLLAKLIVLAVALAVMFRLCLNRDERHAIFNRIGAAFRRG